MTYGRLTPEQIAARDAYTKQRAERRIAAALTLAGHRITSAQWFDPSEGDEWNDHGCYELTLDDGRIIRFTSGGYDASDVYMAIDGTDATDIEC